MPTALRNGENEETDSDLKPAYLRDLISKAVSGVQSLEQDGDKG